MWDERGRVVGWGQRETRLHSLLTLQWENQPRKSPTSKQIRTLRAAQRAASAAPWDDAVLPTGGVRQASQRGQFVYWALRMERSPVAEWGACRHESWGKESGPAEAEAGKQDVL